MTLAAAASFRSRAPRIHQILKKYFATLKDTMRIAQLLEMAKFKQLWIDAAEVEVLAKQRAGRMPSPGRPSAQKDGACPSGRGTAVLLNRKRWAAPPRTAKWEVSEPRGSMSHAALARLSGTRSCRECGQP